MHWVIVLEWIIAMRKCSCTDTLVTSAELQKFRILSCVLVFLMCSTVLSYQILTSCKQEHLQDQKSALLDQSLLNLQKRMAEF